MDIECVATSIISLSISKTEYLSPFINDGDKEPSWDGHIYAYHNKIKNKASLVGRVPVQVKGTENSDFSKDKIRYSVEVSDLRNYLGEGGTVYFVVYIDKNGDGKIYYSCLLPFKINQLLNQAQDQKTISIKLMVFPTENNEKVNIFLNFIRDKKQQASSLDRNILSLTDLTKMGEIKTLSFGYKDIGYNESKPFQYLFNHGVYLYAEPKGFNVKIPVDYIPEIDVAVSTVNNPVCVGDKQFFNHYEVFHKADCDEIHVGKSFVLSISNSNINKLNYKLSGNLRERIKDVEFLLSLLEDLSLSIAGVPLPLLPTDDELSVFNKSRTKEQLEYLQTVQRVFDLLKVQDDLECSNISSEDERHIKALILALIHKQPISIGKDAEIPTVARVHIANLTLLLVFNKLDDGKYDITNFFDKKLWFYSEDKDGNKIDISQYIILTRDSFLELSNINYTSIIDSIFSVPDSELYHNQVNILLLEMLLAFDAGAPNSIELLDTATRISEWLLTKTESVSLSITMLNYIQCVLRSRELNEREFDELCQIVEKKGQDETILIGAYLLMNNQNAARSHFSKLPPEEQEKFRQYPIYKFWKV